MLLQQQIRNNIFAYVKSAKDQQIKQFLPGFLFSLDFFSHNNQKNDSQGFRLKRMTDLANEQRYRKRAYKKISSEERWELIQMVCQENSSIKEASEKINIAQTTARAIISKYKEEGVIFQKKQDQLKRRALENQRNINFHKEDHGRIPNSPVNLVTQNQFPLNFCWFPNFEGYFFNPLQFTFS